MTANTCPKILDTFHLFPKLPNEVRSIIWQEVASFPRTLHLYVDPQEGARDHKYWQNGSALHFDGRRPFRSVRPPPTILHVCRESRAESTRPGFYQQAFIRPPQYRYHWVNFAVDHIRMNEQALRFSPVADLRRVQSLELEILTLGAAALCRYAKFWLELQKLRHLVLRVACYNGDFTNTSEGEKESLVQSFQDLGNWQRPTVKIERKAFRFGYECLKHQDVSQWLLNED